MQAISDEQLIEWVARGDESCLGTLFERYHRSVYQFCLQMTRNPEPGHMMYVHPPSLLKFRQDLASFIDANQ